MKLKAIKLGPLETHPYGITVFKGAKAMLIGSFPIVKFTNPEFHHQIKPTEIDFCYGGEKNQLWPLLSGCFNEDLQSKKQILLFLKRKGIALGDVIHSCRRLNNGSSDSDLKKITFNESLRKQIINHKIEHLIFTSTRVQKWFHQKIGRIEPMKETVLMSCSASGLRAIPNSLKEEHQKWKIAHPHQRTSDFRIYLYRKIFNEKNFPDLN